MLRQLVSGLFRLRFSRPSERGFVAHALEFLQERLPVFTVPLPLGPRFIFQSRLEGAFVSPGRDCHERPLGHGARGLCRKTSNRIDEEPGCPGLPQPETHDLVAGVTLVFRVVSLHETPHHGPVLVSLRLLGTDEILDPHQLDVQPAWQLDRRPTTPQGLEFVHAPKPGHCIDAHPGHVFAMAAEVDGVSPQEVGQLEGRERDPFGAEVGEFHATALGEVPPATLKAFVAGLRRQSEAVP